MIRLFKQLNINYGSFKHIITNNRQDYFDYCSQDTSNYIDITEDNYRLNTGVLRIAIGTQNVAESDYWNYAIEYRMTSGTNPQVTYMRCYWVRDIQVQSGMMILYLDVDEWGSNIWRVNLNNAHITRCNRQLTGAYNDLCDQYADKPLSSTRTFLTPNQAVLVLAIRYNLHESLFSNNVSETRLLAIKVGELQTDFDYVGGDGHLAYINPFEIAVNWAGGLYRMITYDGQSQGATHDLQVLDAWIVPTALCGTLEEFKPEGILLTRFDSAWRPYRDSTITYPTQTQHILYNIKQRQISSDAVSEAYQSMNGAKKYYGTLTEYMEIPNYWGASARKVLRRANYGASTLGVELVYGDKSMDITESFHLELTTNDGNVTGLRGVKKAISLVSATGGIVNALATQNYAGMVSSTGSIIGAMSETSHNVGGGDGFTNFYYGSASQNDNKLYDPFVIWSLSTNNSTMEQNKLNNLGAKCNYFMADLRDIFNNSLYYTGTSIIDNGITYVVAECEVEGRCATSGISYIASEFARGIKVIKYETTP